MSGLSASGGIKSVREKRRVIIMHGVRVRLNVAESISNSNYPHQEHLRDLFITGEPTFQAKLVKGTHARGSSIDGRRFDHNDHHRFATMHTIQQLLFN
jgi:hypothetical protein